MLALAATGSKTDVRVIVCWNRAVPNHPDDDDAHIAWLVEGVVRDYVPAEAILIESTRVWLDGMEVPRERWAERKVPRGAEVYVGVEPADPGTIALNAAMIVISAGINYIAGQILAPPEPKKPPTVESAFGTPQIKTVVGRGHPLPLSYGEGIDGGIIIDQQTGHDGPVGTQGYFTKQVGQFTSRTTIAYGIGPWDDVAGLTAPVDALTLPGRAPAGVATYDKGLIRVNGNDLEDFTRGGSLTARLGRINQDSLPSLNEVQQQVPVDLKFNPNVEIIYQTTNPITGFGIVLSVPNGFYHVKTAGSRAGERDGVLVELDVKIRRTGTTAWTFDVSRYPVGVFYFFSPSLATLFLRFDRNDPITRDFMDQECDISLTWPWDAGPLQSFFPNISGELRFHSVKEFIRGQAPQHPKVVLLDLEMQGVDMSGNLNTVTARSRRRKVWVDDENDITRPPVFAWTDEPFSCIKDYLVSEDGLGLVYTLENLNRAEFLEGSAWSKEQISDGQGGTMQRNALSYSVRGQKSSDAHLQAMFQAASAGYYWSGSQLRVVLDRVATPVQTFSVFGHGNIRARSFRIQPIDRSRRPNAVDVEFMDEDSDYATNVAPAEDLDRIAETGQLVRERVRTESISNYARAAILAEKMIRIGRYVTHRIEFEAFVGAMRAKPGDVIAVHHYVEGWGGISGRVVGNAPGSTSVKLDQDLTVTAGVQCRVAVETTQSGDTVTQVRDVVEGPGTYLAGTTIDISPSWDVTDEPQDQDKFFAGDEAGQGVGPAKLYRIQSIEKGSDQHVRVVALTYDDRIYDRPGVIKPTRALLKPTDRTIPPNVVGLGGRVTKFSSQFKTTERAPSIDLSWKNAEWPYPHGNYIYVAVENIDPDRFIGPIQFTEGEQQTVPNVIEGLTYRFAVSPCSSVGRNHRAPERATQFRIVVPRVGTPSPNLP